MFNTVDIEKIVKELHEVLVKNQVPIKALDNIMDELKNTVYIHTIIQSNDLNKNEFIPSTSDGMGTGVNNYSSSKSNLREDYKYCSIYGLKLGK